MSNLREPIDELDQAYRLFQAAEMAVNGLAQAHERAPMQALMYEALLMMENGLGDLRKAAPEGATS